MLLIGGKAILIIINYQSKDYCQKDSPIIFNEDIDHNLLELTNMMHIYV